MKSSVFFLSAATVLISFVSGCGKPTPVSATGTVKLDGKIQQNVKVVFYPDVAQFDPDKHGCGFGITNDKGEFTIQSPSGEKGIWPGRYKVSFVLWVDNKGKVVPADAKPSEVPGGVKNLFPAIFESPSSSPEIVTVPASGLTHDFDVKS